MRLFLTGWALLLVLGAAGLVARSIPHPASSATAAPAPQPEVRPPTPNALPDFLLSTGPWPSFEQLGAETHGIAAALINNDGSYYCPQVTRVLKMGTDERGWNIMQAICTTAVLDISIHPATGKTSIRPARPMNYYLQREQPKPRS